MLIVVTPGFVTFAAGDVAGRTTACADLVTSAQQARDNAARMLAVVDVIDRQRVSETRDAFDVFSRDFRQYHCFLRETWKVNARNSMR